MKRVVVMLCFGVLLWLGATGTVSALPDCLKGPGFDRTGKITTVDCATGNDCTTACGSATATYIGAVGNDSYWLTSLHAVRDAERIWIDGVLAEVASAGCTTKGEPKCGKMDYYGCNWAVLKTLGYIPCGACPATPIFNKPCYGQGLYFVDVGKCRTVTKVKVLPDCCGADSGRVFRTTTSPSCINCGAVVYDTCGRMVGILVGRGDDACNKCGDGGTEFIQLDERMFEVLKEPTEAGLEIPPFPTA